MSTDERNYQLQGSYTRYEDGLHTGYDSFEGPNKQRNYKTIESAIRAAKRELKKNERAAVAKSVKRWYGDGVYDYDIILFAADGREISWDEPHEYWHTDGVRIVDRKTQKVLWEA